MTQEKDEYQLFQGSNIRILYTLRNMEEGKEERREAISRNVGYLRDYNRQKRIKAQRKIYLGRTNAQKRFLDVFA